MAKIKCGVRAFPVSASDDVQDADGLFFGPQRGMSLRQWYAGQALSGLLCDAKPLLTSADDIAAKVKLSFDLADAMIEHEEAEQRG